MVCSDEDDIPLSTVDDLRNCRSANLKGRVLGENRTKSEETKRVAFHYGNTYRSWWHRFHRQPQYASRIQQTRRTTTTQSCLLWFLHARNKLGSGTRWRSIWLNYRSEGTKSDDLPR